MAVCISWLRMSHRIHLTIAFVLSLLSLHLLLSSHVYAQSEAVAATGEPYRIALMLDSRPDRIDGCHYRGRVPAIRKFAREQEAIINARGGINGRPLELVIRDGHNKADQMVAHVREVLKLPRLIAMIGFKSSQRASAIFDKVGDDINASGIPVIAHVSASEVFADMPNTFSTRRSQRTGRAPVIAAFSKAAAKRDKVALISRNGAIYINDLRAGFEEWVRDQVADYTDYGIDRIKVDGKRVLDDAALDDAISKIASSETNFIVLAVGSTNSAQVLDKLISELKSKDNNSKPTIMILGRPSRILSELSQTYSKASQDYGKEFFFLDLDDVPEVEQDTIRNKVNKNKPEEWFFGDVKRLDAQGWRNGTCKAPNDKDVFSENNVDAIRYGGHFADMIALVVEAINAEAASFKKIGPDKKELIAKKHEAVLKSLKETYQVGCSAFRGRFENWSFDPDTRSRAKLPFILISPPGLDGSIQLAQKQFVQIRPKDARSLTCKGEKKSIRKKTLRPIDTLYLDIDLERIYSVDDNERSFYADFYLSMRFSDELFDSYSEEDVLKTIRFDNAFVSPFKNGPHLTIEPIYTGDKNADGQDLNSNRSISGERNKYRASDIYPRNMRIYFVSGRFRFDPEFKDYPFDKQKFAISIKPQSGGKLFVIQPPPFEFRDKNVDAKNWLDTRDGQYVSYREQLLPMIDAFTHNPSVVPLYQTRFVWELQREVRDYLVQVIIPLALMLLVAYLSVFIPQRHLEAIITLQVTALLAAVALYLSLPQIDSDTATVSDRFFMLDYAMVSLMIFISILRLHVRPQDSLNSATVSEEVDEQEDIARWRKIFDYILLFTHVFAIPLLVMWFLTSTVRTLPEEAVNQLTWERLARAIFALGG